MEVYNSGLHMITYIVKWSYFITRWVALFFYSSRLWLPVYQGTPFLLILTGVFLGVF